MALRRLAIVVELVGLAVVVYGVWVVWPPGAFMLAGGSMFVLAQGIGGKP